MKLISPGGKVRVQEVSKAQILLRQWEVTKEKAALTCTEYMSDQLITKLMKARKEKKAAHEINLGISYRDT